MIDKIITFMRQAAKTALENQEKINLTNLHFKEDKVGSVVTATDLMISKQFKEFVEKYFSEYDKIIIDEESLSDLGEDKFTKVQNAEYQFVIDPIDGTHMFALKMPFYAISVGIMKNCKPYLGAICFPALGELVYFDGNNVRWIKKLNSAEEEEEVINPAEMSRLALIFDNTWFVKINDNLNCQQDTIVNLYSCIVHFFYMVTQRGYGHYFGSFLWDMAGAWPILQALGFGFFDYENKKILEDFNCEDFKDNFLIKKLHIVCRSKDFDYLRNIVELRKK